MKILRVVAPAVAAWFLLLPGCDRGANPPPFPPYRPGTTCAASCAHRAELGCLDATPSPKGATCETMCEDVNKSGLAKWPTDCLVVTRTCDEGRSCRPAP